LSPLAGHFDRWRGGKRRDYRHARRKSDPGRFYGAGDVRVAARAAAGSIGGDQVQHYW
jgi:hypothetical protein